MNTRKNWLPWWLPPLLLPALQACSATSSMPSLTVMPQPAEILSISTSDSRSLLQRIQH